MKAGIILQMFLDILALGVVAGVVLVLNNAVEPFHRGFFCDDESIKHPFKESTISTAVLIIVGTGLPVAGMLIGEALIFCRGSGHKRYQMCSRDVHPYIWSCYKTIGVFLFGAMVNQLFTDICKYTIGRLRPHFLSVCMPEYASLNCSTADDLMGYVVDYTCTGDPKLVHEARLSFLSGHASYSMYSMMYLAIYIQARLRWRRSRLLKPFLQVLVLSLAVLTGLSRISDYKHHWSDVLAGTILGILVALIMSTFVSDLFKDKYSFSIKATSNNYKKSDQYGSTAQSTTVSEGNLEQVEIR